MGAQMAMVISKVFASHLLRIFKWKITLSIQSLFVVPLRKLEMIIKFKFKLKLRIKYAILVLP
ncbi:MAG: hypothetical protein J7F05_09645 [Trichodesmium erythraeum GBRTRLIN201]|nr:hypothetical protein [Trichodesmium erythraeum GBRTRLIN201]